MDVAEESVTVTDPSRDTDRCPCGNQLNPDGAPDLCDWCDAIRDEPPHVGHISTFGTHWCDTCNSPYCNLI